MIGKAIVVGLSLLGLYSAALLAVPSRWQRTALTAPMGNLIRVEQFAYGTGRANEVIVGTSLSERLAPDLSAAGFETLTLGGGDVLTGIEAILRSGRPVRRVWIEANFPPSRPDPVVMDYVFRPPWDWMRRWVPAMRACNQPSAVLATWMGGGLPSEAADPAPGLEAVGLARFQREFSVAPNAAAMEAGLARLEAAVARLRKSGAEVVFFRLPIHGDLEATPWVVAVKAAFSARFGAGENRWAGMPPLQAFRTTDGIHLGREGARRFAGFLVAEATASRL